MPSYKVLEPGFYGGRMYSPRGKRPVLHTDKPFKKVPSWLEPLKDTNKAAAARKKAESARKKADQEAAAEDKKLVDSVTFTSDPSLSGPIETL